MDWNMMDGMMGAFMWFWLIFAVLVLALLVVGVVWLVRTLAGPGSATSAARQELDLRYARGPGGVRDPGPAADPALGRPATRRSPSGSPATRWSGQPRYQTTHAVTIQAPRSEVWPWLVQLGQGRGGLYSYDWLENLLGLGFASADRIIPELQTLEVGDQVWLAPRDSAMPLWYQVLDLQPPQTLVLGPHGDRNEALAQGLPWPTWTFVLRDLGNGSTRLGVRMRSDFKPTPLGLLVNKYALEPVHFAMERKMHQAPRRTSRNAVSPCGLPGGPGSDPRSTV